MRYCRLNLHPKESLFCSIYERLVSGNLPSEHIYIGVGKSDRVVDLLCPKCLELEKEKQNERIR